MRYAPRERSAWINGITLDVPVTPVRSAREAAALADLGGFDREPAPSAVEEELARLRALLAGAAVEVGPRSADSTSTVIAEWVGSLGTDPESLADVNTVMTALRRNEALIPALAGLESVDDLTSTIRRWQQHAGLDRLQAAVNDPASTREFLHEVLSQEWWVFGGQLLPFDAQPIVAKLEVRCIPLLRYDRAIHAVVVERACVEDLVFRGDEGWHLSPSLYAALDRARTLVDELEQRRSEIGALSMRVECSRALVTVVVGHPKYLNPAAPLPRVREEIRRLNTHLSEVNVVTYEELINVARQLLNRTAPKLGPVGGG